MMVSSYYSFGAFRGVHGAHYLTSLWKTASKVRTSTSTSRFRSVPNGFPSLLAFAGVFDGHNGPKASEYCAKGLLPHILLEAESKKPTTALRKRRFSPTITDSGAEIRLQEAVQDLPPLESIYVRAFHHAHERFGSGMEPPEMNKAVTKQMSWRSLLRRKTNQPEVFGGTTACTLSLVSS